jgi:hypothetical protein
MNLDVSFYLILVLLALNVFQIIFWSRTTHKLIDKLMSRSYFEYKEADKKKLPVIKVAEDPIEHEDLRVMDDYLSQMV